MPQLSFFRVAAATLALSLAGCQQSQPPAATATDDAPAARRAIVALLTEQTAAWNKGDMPGFMEGYWKSDSLVFLGRKGPTYGWQQNLAYYQKYYPNAAAMGQLDFSGLRVSLLNPDAAQVLGHWHLAYSKANTKDQGGYFLLVLRKIDGKWKVAADHTNSQ